MTLRRRGHRPQRRCADAPLPRGEQPPAPTSAGYHLVRLLGTWPGTLRLLLVLVVAAALLVAVMIVTPLQLDLGPVQVAPAAVR